MECRAVDEHDLQPDSWRMSMPMSFLLMQAAAPRLGLVLGSGLGAVAEALGIEAEVSYRDVPGLHASTVPGHAGRFVLVRPGGMPVLIAQGRSHLYEGLTAAQVTAQVRVMHSLGVRTLVLSNAAGAINNTFCVGELMLLSDHLNLTGTSPLLGGPNFKDMTEVYSKRLRAVLHSIAQVEGFPLHEGVYAGLLGPQYETPAEIRMLRTLGADAVGMSTVLEAIQARALGMEVAGISTLTNWAAGLAEGTLNHEEVMATGRRAIGQMTALVRGLAGL
jgi:purine-nucleoside phosphorylase